MRSLRHFGESPAIVCQRRTTRFIEAHFVGSFNENTRDLGGGARDRSQTCLVKKRKEKRERDRRDMEYLRDGDRHGSFGCMDGELATKVFKSMMLSPQTFLSPHCDRVSVLCPRCSSMEVLGREPAMTR